MAMIGRGAAMAEVGAHRHELHGAIAFAAWLGVHASLMTGVRNRIDAFVAWGSDYFSQRARSAGARPLRRGADRLGARTPGHGHRSRRRRPDVARRHDVDLARGQFATSPRSTTSCSSRSRSASRRSSRSCRRSGTAPATSVAAADPLLRDAPADQLRDRRRHRARAGVPVRHELVRVLRVRRGRLRRAAGDRGPRRVLAGGDVPRALGLRLGPAVRRACTSRRSGSSRSARGCRPTSSSSRTRGCSTRSARAVVDGEAQLTNVWDLLTSRFALYAFTHTMLVGAHDRRARGPRRRLLAPRARAQRGAVPPRGSARADRRCADHDRST